MATILWILAAALLLIWLLGVGGVYSVGGLVHLFLVLAILALVINLFTGRRTAL